MTDELPTYRDEKLNAAADILLEHDGETVRTADEPRRTSNEPSFRAPPEKRPEDLDSDPLGINRAIGRTEKEAERRALEAAEEKPTEHYNDPFGLNDLIQNVQPNRQTEDVLKSKSQWIQEQAAVLENAKARNLINQQQYQYGRQILANEVNNLKYGMLQLERAKIDAQKGYQRYIDELAKDIPEYTTRENREQIDNQLINFARELGIPDEVIFNVRDPRVVKAVYRLMKDTHAKDNRIKSLKGKTSNQLKQLVNKEDKRFGKPMRSESSALKGSAAKVQSVADLLMKVGAA